MCLPIPGGYTYFRCPHAELHDDENVSWWLTRYFDSQRMNVTRPDVDEIPALELAAFRTIEQAINDTQRRDAERRARKQDQDRKTKTAGSGSVRVPSPRPRAPRRSGRARR